MVATILVLEAEEVSHFGTTKYLSAKDTPFTQRTICSNELQRDRVCQQLCGDFFRALRFRAHESPFALVPVSAMRQKHVRATTAHFRENR